MDRNYSCSEEYSLMSSRDRRGGNGLAWATVLGVGLICSALEVKKNLEIPREVKGKERMDKKEREHQQLSQQIMQVTEGP